MFYKHLLFFFSLSIVYNIFTKSHWSWTLLACCVADEGIMVKHGWIELGRSLYTGIRQSVFIAGFIVHFILYHFICYLHTVVNVHQNDILTVMAALGSFR